MCSAAGRPDSRKYQHIGHAPVEEHRSGGMLGDAVRPHFPAQHQFSKEHAITPGQRLAADCHLILNDAPASLDGSRVANSLEPVDKRTLPRARPAGHNEKTIGCFTRHRLPLIKTLGLPLSAISNSSVTI
jgi:hypothetical protein